MSQVPSSAEILNAFEEYLIAVCGFSPRTVDSYSRYTKLLLREIQEEYVSWFSNNDRHLDYFTGNSRVFTQKMLIDDFIKG